MNIEEIKRDIVDYNLYHVVDNISYGEYLLNIINEDDKIIIIVHDNQGSATWTMTKNEFLDIPTTLELKKHINSILYYNYTEYEGE